MRKVKSMFRVSMLNQLQYKGAYISGVICQIAFGFLYLMLYRAFFEQGVPQDFNIKQMTTYVWLGQAFFAMFCFFDVCKDEISKPIISGDVGYQMVKPINLYGYWFTTIICKSCASTIVRCLPLLLVAFLIPAGYGMSLPVSFSAFLLFILALILGIVLLTAIRMICYLIITYTLDAKGVFTIVGAIHCLLSGGIIPIPLMPAPIQTILNFTPFRYTSDLAYRIYIGNIGTTTALWQMGVQLIWIVGFVGVGSLLLNKKSKKLVVQGG